MALLIYRNLEARGHGSAPTVWRKVRDGKLPRPKDYFGRPRWLEEEIEALERSLPEYDSTAHEPRSKVA